MAKENLEMLRQQTEEIYLKRMRLVGVGWPLFIAFICFLTNDYPRILIFFAIAIISERIIQKGFREKKDIIYNGDIIYCTIDKKEKWFKVHYWLVMPDGKSIDIILSKRIDNLLGSPVVGSVLPFFYKASPSQGVFPVLHKKK